MILIKMLEQWSRFPTSRSYRFEYEVSAFWTSDRTVIRVHPISSLENSGVGYVRDINRGWTLLLKGKAVCARRWETHRG